MAWFSGKVSLGGFPDLAGAVNKFSESVKSIEKNFDSALGFEEKSDSAGEASGLWPTATDRKALFDPVMAFMGNQDGENSFESSQQPESLPHPSPAVEREDAEADRPHATKELIGPAEEENEVVNIEKEHDRSPSTTENVRSLGEENEVSKIENGHTKTHPDTTEETNAGSVDINRSESDPRLEPVEQDESTVENIEKSDTFQGPHQHESFKTSDNLLSMEERPESVNLLRAEGSAFLPDESQNGIDLHERTDEQKMGVKEMEQEVSQSEAEPLIIGQAFGESELSASDSASTGVADRATEFIESQLPSAFQPAETPEAVIESGSDENDATVEEDVMIQRASDNEANNVGNRLSSVTTGSDSDSVVELEKVKMEMKMMETALQGAARQAQAKADEIAKLMNENEQLKSVIEDSKRKSNEAEMESLREEYHQRVAALERKVYALTKERDTLRREQNRKSDAAALLKEKDEIINQVMAEGEELSKKQAAQESQIRKLRAQIREFEEEKKGLITKLQVEENKVDSIKKDKAATEKLLQETIERHQAELSAQKEYFTNALAVAKEAETLAEARANNEARTELESRLRVAEEREAMLVQALEELRQTLSRNEQQAIYREDMLRRDIEDLQKRYQASERRCEELITQVPESTRPLLRQIEAMQETTGRRAEAWAAVERSLNSRLQEAEGKAAAAEEIERSINGRLSQTLSRINVLEAQISCLRAEQIQLSRSLEKERQRAAEIRQEYLAAKEQAVTHEGRANQLEEELRDLRRKHKEELQDAFANRELLQQEVEREKTARIDLERTARLQSSAVSDQTPNSKLGSAYENGNLTRTISSASSLGSVEEGYFLQASLDSSENFLDRRNLGEITMSPYYMKSMTPAAFESALRQKEGELASYISRLASLESIRDSLAEELVKLTGQCENLRAESAMLPGLRAELDALRRRHSSALELMGERDEELEELRADIVDLKEMYKEQVNLLVNKIQILSSSVSSTG